MRRPLLPTILMMLTAGCIPPGAATSDAPAADSTQTGTQAQVTASEPSKTPVLEPAAEPAAEPAEPRLAVLLYHHVDPEYTSDYTITPEELESHVVMLLKEGYTFYSLEDIQHLLDGDAGMPAKGVMLTFDDGYESFYTEVMPIAEKYDIPVTCFVVTNFLVQPNPQALPHMRGSEMRELAKSKLADLGGHSHNAHRNITAPDGSQQPFLTSPMLDAQTGAEESTDQYQARIQADFAKNAEMLRVEGVTTGLQHFAFPFNQSTPAAVHMGQAAGFRYFYIGDDALVTAQTDPTAIPRINAGSPGITADVLKKHLADLFAAS